MEINKKFIFWFNKNKSKEEYSKVFEIYFKGYKKCRSCNNPVYYYDSTFLLSKNGELKLHKKSCLTSKILDKEYFLTICEDCLCQKFPEYVSKNKSRVFNQMNYITEYAFNITPEKSLKWMKESYAITEDNMKRKYGEEIGLKKWKEYCDKQSISNTFEYKREKHGWTRDKFDEFNKSRAVTLENLVKKHGEESGLILWRDYCDRQKYTTSLDYFISEYGIDNGTEKYNNFCKKRMFEFGYSNISQELFKLLDINLVNNFNKMKTYYYIKNNEYVFEFHGKKESFNFYIDYYIKELNIGIEFNGDIWHANPKKYKPEDKPFPFNKGWNAQDIWNKDKVKNDFLRTKLNKLIIIWEDDLNKDGIDKTVDKIIKEIYE